MNTFAQALTSALIDFVWQGTFIGIIAAVGLRALRNRSASSRYLLGLVALAALIAVPIITTASRYLSGTRSYRAAITVAGFAAGGGDQRVMPAALPAAATPVLTRVQPWVLPIWSLGVLLLSLRLVAGGVEVRTLRRSATSVDDQLRERASRLAARMGVIRPVQLVMSARADGPSVIGWLRPLILLPPATAMGLTTTQLDAVLAHELAHIRRHDYLVNIVQIIAETLLFYHPAVWWVSARLRTERELCCDDEAVSVCGDAPAYARALVTMARHQVAAMAIGSAGGSLTDRVRRLLGAGGHEPRRSATVGAVAIVIAIVPIALVTVNAQKDRPRFEVASIRPAPAENRPFGGAVFLPGGVVRVTQAPLWWLVAAAYDVRFQQVEGKSDILDERFAIDAKANANDLPPATGTYAETLLRQAPVLRRMLQTLLAERFKLAVHVEKRDSPMYALVVGSNGHKLKAAAKDCTPRSAAEDGRNGPCGIRGGGPANGLRLHGAELSELALGLTSFAGRVVVDRTGVTGRFDIDLPPWSTGQPPRDQSAEPNPEPQPDPDNPSIFAVLQQLGLRLEATRGPIEYYVVDHVERPTPN